MTEIRIDHPSPDAGPILRRALENYAQLQTCIAVRYESMLNPGETEESNDRKAQTHRERSEIARRMADQLPP